MDLINGKIRGEVKLNQIKSNFSFHYDLLPLDTSSFIDKYWLSGFADADAYFFIHHQRNKNNNKIYFTLRFDIRQKKAFLLKIINNEFPGTLKDYYHNDQYYWLFSSGSKANTIKLINYFDSFPLLSYKAYNYALWKEAAEIIKSGEHLRPAGIEKILAIKKSMKYKNP
jgi:hypothetical protein